MYNYLLKPDWKFSYEGEREDDDASALSPVHCRYQQVKGSNRCLRVISELITTFLSERRASSCIQDVVIITLSFVGHFVSATFSMSICRTSE